MNNTIANQKALQDYAEKLSLRRGLKCAMRRMWIKFLIAFKTWDISNSDNALAKMYGEQQQVSDDIATELKVRCGLTDDVRKLRASL